MYDTSVNKSEKRTPALTASQTGSFGQRQSVMACASANAAHWPAERRKSSVADPPLFPPPPCSHGRRERTLKLASQLRVQLLERSKVFFCIGFSSHPRKELRAILIGLGHLWFDLDRLVVMFERL
jgi:hypothetical protein